MMAHTTIYSHSVRSAEWQYSITIYAAKCEITC